MFGTLITESSSKHRSARRVRRRGPSSVNSLRRAPLVALLPLALSVACFESAPAKIGVILPLTGTDADLGLEARRGLEASFGSLENPVMVFDIRDSASDPEKARQQLEALIDEGAVATIGGVTPAEARALATTSDSRERVLLLPSASEQSLSTDSKWVYRLTASDADAGSAIATFASRRLQAKIAIVLAPDAGHGEALESGFAPTFENLGGEVLDRVEASGDPLGERIAELARSQPDLALLAGDAAWQTGAIRALLDAGFKGHIFGDRHLAHPKAMAELAKTDKVLFAHSGFDPSADRPAVQSFVAGFTLRHGHAPEGITAQVAAEAWDAVQVLDLALRDRPALPSEIRRGLRDEVKDYAGASGHLEFDSTGSVTSFPKIYSVTADGKIRDHGGFLDQEAERVAEARRRLHDKLLKLQAGMVEAAEAPVPPKDDDPENSPGA